MRKSVGSKTTLAVVLVVFVVVVVPSLEAGGAEAALRSRSRSPKGARPPSSRAGTGLAESAAGGVNSSDAAESRKQAKFFPIFNIVTFSNVPCVSTMTSSGTSTTNRNGTCLTMTTCQDNGGTAAGNCAAGFGVCCVFIVSAAAGGTIAQNCTYIQNNGFPTALSGTTSASFTVNKCSSNVCDLRLDFETFTTSASGVTTEVNGGNCMDMFTITTSSSGQTYPTICGDNTGQHVYLNLGNQGTDTATLAFTFSGTNTNRIFDIKVTQVDCTSLSRPPDGCLQYHTGSTGRITSFNFNPATGETHLPSQQYSVCIRQEQGFCCVQYAPCANTINPFTLDTSIAGMATSLIDTQCSEDYVVLGEASLDCVAGSTGTPVFSRLCGVFFNSQPLRTASVPVCDCHPPFSFCIRTDATADVATINTSGITSRGVCVEYTQLAC